MANIVVLGSINMDVVNRVHKHPLPGETVKGYSTGYYPGGKGANQAVAASMAGGAVTMIGAVGQDPFGAELLSSLQKYSVRTDIVLQKEGTSGMAFITVDAHGENNIILSEGANGKLTVEDVRNLLPVLTGADIVLLQNEIPWETTKYMLKELHRLGKSTKEAGGSFGTGSGPRVFFNPAPAAKECAESLAYVDVIVLNETEAEVITGTKVENEETALKAALEITERGPKAVILTLGEKGSLYVQQGGTSFRTPAFKVDAADTTAAGDTFIGAFAAASLSKGTVEEALRFASAAAALTVSREGAQASIPNRGEIEAFAGRSHFK